MKDPEVFHSWRCGWRCTETRNCPAASLKNQQAGPVQSTFNCCLSIDFYSEFIMNVDASKSWPKLKLSEAATRTTSPIFSLFQKLSQIPPPKPFISLALGEYALSS